MSKHASPQPLLPKRVSLVTQTVESLQSALQDGHWHGYLPGERELCAQLQVSRQTLRSALAILRKNGMVETTTRQRQRILASSPLTPAKSDSSLIAAISSRPLEAMSQSSVVMVDQLRADLARSGFELAIHASAACFSAHPARALDALVSRSPAAAWLLFGSLEPMQKWFIRRQIPCLVVGSCAQGVDLPSVDADYRATCRHAGALLLRKGHRHIAFVRTMGDYGGDIESELGLREALHGTSQATMEVVRHNGTPADLCAKIDRTLRQTKPPTAYIVARSMHVLTVMMHLMLKGKRIPADVAVLSRDDDTFLQHAVPEITRYTASQTQFARKVSIAARHLAENTPLPRVTCRLMPRLVAGATV